MMVLVTKKAPDFTASAILGTGKIINNFNLKSYINNHMSIIFFWPMDFTFVCPTEIIAFDKRYSEFVKRNIKIVGVSIDSVFVHQAWKAKSLSNGGIGNIQYPMVSDLNHNIIKNYGIEHPVLHVALRGSFLIDKLGIIRHQVINDLPIGRNIDEIIRTADALLFHETYGKVCPAQWKNKEDGIFPKHSEVIKFFSRNKEKL